MTEFFGVAEGAFESNAKQLLAFQSPGQEKELAASNPIDPAPDEGGNHSGATPTVGAQVKAATPADLVADYGWIIEVVESGGIRMRFRTVGKALMASAWFGLLVLIAGGTYLAFPRELAVLPQNFGQVMMAAIALPFVAGVALACLGLILMIGWLIFGREEWEVDANRLEVRRSLFGFARTHQYCNAELLVEPYRSRRRHPTWRLAIKSDGEQRYLISDSTISDHGGFTSERADVEGVARLLAEHTGWRVRSAQREADEAARALADRQELPAALTRRGFRAGVNEHFRLTVRPPQRIRLFLGPSLVIIGTAWTMCWSGGLTSFVRDAGVAQHPIVNLPFLALFVLALLAGAVAVLIGIGILLSREVWSIDRNQLTAQLGIFGWNSERHFADAVLNLYRTIHKSPRRARWYWHLALRNHAGDEMKRLCMDQEEEVPRLLAAALSECTGWPVHEEPVR